MSKAKKVFSETLPILIGIIFSYLFWQNNLLLLCVYVVLVAATILIHKDKTEIIIFIYGFLVGLIVEYVGTQISGYQSFTNPDIGGMPLWLPIAWGYGFVAMKRVGFALKGL